MFLAHDRRTRNGQSALGDAFLYDSSHFPFPSIIVSTLDDDRPYLVSLQYILLFLVRILIQTSLARPS
jgi:hypothetical protein